MQSGDLLRPHSERRSSTDRHQWTSPQPLPDSRLSSDARIARLDASFGESPNLTQGSSTALPEQAARPNFTALYTLIEDVHAASDARILHPTVKYIFSDDDEVDPVTDTALRLAEEQHHPAQDFEKQIARHQDAHGKANPRQSRAHEPVERVLLVTLDASGTRVASAHSLASDWQILGARLGAAPTLDSPADGSDANDGDTAGLMLQIEGTDGGPQEPSRASVRSRTTREKSPLGRAAANLSRGDTTEPGQSADADTEARTVHVEALVELYRSRMDELRCLLDRAEETSIVS